MALRQVAGDPKVKAKNIEESVEKAKEAVELDIKDGTSWREYLVALFCSHSTTSSSTVGLRHKIRAHSRIRAHHCHKKDISDSFFNLYFSVVLGNAYLSLFFASNQSTKILKLCMSAYQQAVSISVTFLYSCAVLLLQTQLGLMVSLGLMVAHRVW